MILSFFILVFSRIYLYNRLKIINIHLYIYSIYIFDIILLIYISYFPLINHNRVFANVSWEVVKPYPDQPTEGFLRFNTEMSPMASPEFESEK